MIELNNDVCFELKTHMLIAGCTGSGKSTALKRVIDSLILSKNTSFIMIDLKRIELNIYASLKSLLLPIAKDEMSALDALEKACNEMDRRYKLIDQNDNCIDQFRALYVCVDEIAELTQSINKDVAKECTLLLSRLARLGRACKIHLIVATQYPTRQVLSMQVLMNLDYRLCLKTATKQGSRVVLDNSMAFDRLFNVGDAILNVPMLYNMLKLHINYDSPDYIKAVINARNQANAR
jgi:S-DNA-T family DNA segregation ATPase FtsK/SpoIIIE